MDGAPNGLPASAGGVAGMAGAAGCVPNGFAASPEVGGAAAGVAAAGGLAAGAAYGVWAFYNDKDLWRNKPRDVLEKMIVEHDWKRIQAALQEVRRRGEDILPYRPIILRLLVSTSKADRVAGRMAVRKLYPDVARELTGYVGTEDIETCIAKATPVLRRYGVLPPVLDGNATHPGVPS